MTIKQHLEERVNARIAKELWDKISTELEQKAMSGAFNDERDRFIWLAKRAKELLKEYVNAKETAD